MAVAAGGRRWPTAVVGGQPKLIENRGNGLLAAYEQRENYLGVLRLEFYKSSNRASVRGRADTAAEPHPVRGSLGLVVMS